MGQDAENCPPARRHDTYHLSQPQFSRRLNRSENLSMLARYFDDGESYELNSRWSVEVSWEVCNQVGGIYTVIRSKTHASVREMGNRYVLLGPYVESKARHEFEEDTPDVDDVITRAVHLSRKRGYKVLSGRWLVDGYPRVVLFDISSGAPKLSEWKHELYEKASIGIPNEDCEVNDVCLFGFMTAHFLADLRTEAVNVEKEPHIVCQFHEWMSGIGLIMTRLYHIDIALIFTTHATLLGRHLCAGSTDFYNSLATFNCDFEAGQRGFYHRYCIEKAATHIAHVFTTVSDITGQEAKYLLGREPDLITPNGLNVKRALHEFQNLHAESKEKIHDFVRGHFSGHFDFNLDNTLYFFIAGRYEFGNKGADIFIEALAHLNYMLKRTRSDKTVIAFLIFPARTASFNVNTLERHAVKKSLKETVEVVQKRMGERLYDSCLRGTIPEATDLIHQDDLVKLKRGVVGLESSSLPPITTHNVVDDANDAVLNAIRRCQLFNTTSDRVKVVFHAEFLRTSNPLFGMDYQDFVRGCHLGVFPSYYEPWGYTPAECTVMGIPSVTTNLSGFGCFIETQVEDSESYGIYVVDRRHRSPSESVAQLANHMFDFSHLNRRQRIILRNRTERLSDLLDWKSLGLFYKQARSLAISRVYPGAVDDTLDGIDYSRSRSSSVSSGYLLRRCTSVIGSGRSTPQHLSTHTSSLSGEDGNDEDDENNDDDDNSSHDSEAEQSELNDALLMSRLSLAK